MIEKWNAKGKEGVSDRQKIVKEGNDLSNYALTKCNLGLYEGRKEMFYLTMHSTHFLYGYTVSDIW